MTPISCFQTLYHQYIGDAYQATPIEKLAKAFLDHQPIESGLVEQILVEESDLTEASPWELVEKWRELLTTLLIVREKNAMHSYLATILQRVRYLKSLPFWSEFQLLAGYRAIVDVLVAQPTEDPSICQLPSGACPLESGGHWSWGDIPHPALHAELGAIWGLYGTIAGKPRFLQAAENLAEWQLNTLDQQLLPFVGLFSQEGDTSAPSLFAANFVLFDVVARIARRPDVAFVAERQMHHLMAYMGQHKSPISAHTVILATFINSHTTPIATDDYRQAHSFEDGHLALAGCRTPAYSAVATLFGGGTGLGCFHHGDIQVVNFGPHHLPLGDCRGFGVEGSGRLLAARLKTVASSDEAFSVEGVARMAPRAKATTSPGTFRHGDPAGIWIDTKIDFEKNRFGIETTYSGIFDEALPSFAFFVKAQRCVVGNKETIRPRSFKHYQGAVDVVHMHGETGSLGIEANFEGREMHVIPLGGGHNFWGADFLIAYQCEQAIGCHRWQIASLHK